MGDQRCASVPKEEKWREYSIVRVLGRGTQGKVREAIHLPTGRKCAIKTIAKRAGDASSVVEAEAGILRGLRHPHVIRLLDLFETSRSYALVFELAEGGTLFDRIVELRTFTEEDAAVCLATVLNAVCFLHARGIVHRDLKTSNLQFRSQDPNAPLLILDFGIAKINDPRTLLQTQIGSPLFMAPEILQGKGYTKAVDIFSLGVIAVQCLTGRHPCAGYSDQADLFRRIMGGSFDFSEETWDSISPEAMDFCRKLLAVDPAERLTADEAMRHPWIQQFTPPAYLEALRQVNIEAEEDSDPVRPASEKPTVQSLLEDPALGDRQAVASPHSADGAAADGPMKLQRTRTADHMPGVLSVAAQDDASGRLPNLIANERKRSRFRSVVLAAFATVSSDKSSDDEARSRSRSETELPVHSAPQRILGGLARRGMQPMTALTASPESTKSPPLPVLTDVEWDVDDDEEDLDRTPQEAQTAKAGAADKTAKQVGNGWYEYVDERSDTQVIADIWG
ncbi:kinase-like domain-containing protein [Hyaloraphidium curvatum]|nr:kinase-like domain-containing protein [Hyaloraphidium curvatum]